VEPGVGFYAWVEHPQSGVPRTIFWRQWFTIAADDGVLEYGQTEVIYTSANNYISSFDLRLYDSVTMFVVHEGDEILVIEDIAGCIGAPSSCTSTDGVVVYALANGKCVSDTASSGGCYEPNSPILNVQADSIFLNVSKNVDTSQGKIYAIVEINRIPSLGWTTPQMLIGGGIFYEATAESISANGRWLSVNWLDIQQTQPSGHRILFLDLDQCPCDPNAPLVPDLPGQNKMYWHTSWTAEDKVLMLGKEGKRKKTTRPVFDLDPFSGDLSRTEINIINAGHVGIDSNL